mmetsp:Transcript_8169/g.14784  ORF Transcript_8169/g.14784 Transcript_8169/m.14784 type:complete len:104 (-) Transcript_8169:691-1002(-)
MMYYPDENNTPSWANTALGSLGYNTNPAKIQLLLRKFFEEATRYVHVSFTTHTCFALNYVFVKDYLRMLKVVYLIGTPTTTTTENTHTSHTKIIVPFAYQDHK